MIYGNLTRDPEVKALPSGVPVCSFSVATNRTWKDKNGTKQDSVDFHNIVVFQRQAEIVGQYLRKGSAVYVEGRIQTRSWDAKDGTKQYRTEIVAETIQFGPKGGEISGGSTSGFSPRESASTPPSMNNKGAPGPQPELETIEYPDEDINPNDIPF